MDGDANCSITHAFGGFTQHRAKLSAAQNRNDFRRKNWLICSGLGFDFHVTLRKGISSAIIVRAAWVRQLIR
jgi:hypothetical protein